MKEYTCETNKTNSSNDLAFSKTNVKTKVLKTAMTNQSTIKKS